MEKKVPVFVEKTICDDCPCLNSDDEYGTDCNLGYDVTHDWTKDKYLCTCSSECNLEVVKFAGGYFRPTRKELVTDLHPMRWRE